MKVRLGKIPGSPKGKETIMVGSVNTNISAQVALSALNYTGTQLNQVRKRISTGLNVADANDNGAVFAIAQGLRSTVGAIAAVNGQLGAAKGLLSVANAAGTGVSNTLVDIRSVLVQLADSNVTGNARNQLNAQYATLKSAVNNYISGATYNGANLLLQQVLQTNQLFKDISANQYLLAAQDLNTNVTAALTNVTDSNRCCCTVDRQFRFSPEFRLAQHSTRLLQIRNFLDDADHLQQRLLGCDNTRVLAPWSMPIWPRKALGCSHFRSSNSLVPSH